MSTSTNDDFVELVFGDLEHFNIERDIPKLESLVRRCQDNPDAAEKLSKALILWAADLRHRFSINLMVNYPQEVNKPSADLERIVECLNKLKVIIAERFPETMIVSRGSFGGLCCSIKVSLKEIFSENQTQTR